MLLKRHLFVAYQALGKFDISRPLRPWLLSISVNLARNRRRSAGRFLAALRRVAQLETPQSVPIEDRHEQRWRSQALWSAVRQLSRDDQQIVYLRYFLELPVDETSLALGIPAGTVKSRLYRALTRLRKIIERNYPDLKDLSA
jgi:RNA polymerase sigma-70 factor (ECF subfamily)